jgi:hypothetical protein
MLRSFTRYDSPEQSISALGSAMSDGLGKEVSTALVHWRPETDGMAMSKGSQYMFIITCISGLFSNPARVNPRALA